MSGTAGFSGEGRTSSAAGYEAMPGGAQTIGLGAGQAGQPQSPLRGWYERTGLRADPRRIEFALEERDRLVEHPGDLRAKPLLLERPEVLPGKGLDLRPPELRHSPIRAKEAQPCTIP